MVTFNIHNGKMKCRAPSGAGYWNRPGHPGYENVFLPTPPLKSLQLSSAKEVGKIPEIIYYADSLGNIEVSNPKHMASLSGLGFPIYQGGLNPGAVVRPDDLLWPDKLNPEDPYERAILVELRKRIE